MDADSRLKTISLLSGVALRATDHMSIARKAILLGWLKLPKVTYPFPTAGSWFGGGALGKGAKPTQAGRRTIFSENQESKPAGGEMGVADEVFDGIKAGGIRIANPGGLHGCRLARKGRQPVAAGMAGQVDQDVYAIVNDGLRQRVVIERIYLPPPEKFLPQSPGCVVSYRRRGIAV